MIRFLISLLSIAAFTNLYGQQIAFSEVALSQGINHTYPIGLGAGVSFVDINNDGWPDLTLPSDDGEPVQIYLNQQQQFLNSTFQYNITDLYESKTVLWVDFDNDMDRDLFITNVTGENRLYRMDDDGMLVDISDSSGISTATLQTIAACWADYDNDGLLDLYIANYPMEISNLLYRNLGNGKFEDVTALAGVADDGKMPLAVSFLDYDNDGWQDLYTANDRGTINSLYRNRGDGSFEDVSVASNSDLMFNAMGIAIGDYDDNGFSDMYITNTSNGNGLLRNNGDGTFTEVADSLGVGVQKLCWGTNFFDCDNDGDLDLFVSAEWGPTNNADVLFANNGNGQFLEVVNAGFSSAHNNSHGNAIADFNRDGYEDIAVLTLDPENLDLWENSGGFNRWLQLRLVSTSGNSDAVGSRIDYYISGKPRMRTTHCGISYLSQNSYYTTLGMGTDRKIDSLIVSWPSGNQTHYYDLAELQRLILNENGTISNIGETSSGVLPKTPVILPSYPNPFNSSTIIRFQLPAAKSVKMDLYSISGQLISSYDFGYLSAGTHERTFEAGNLPSGVYLYHILGQSAKLVLIR